LYMGLSLMGIPRDGIHRKGAARFGITYWF